jgi:hypothetical protein
MAPTSKRIAIDARATEAALICGGLDERHLIIVVLGFCRNLILDFGKSSARPFFFLCVRVDWCGSRLITS